MQSVQAANDYKEIKTPQLIDRSLCGRQAGHASKFSDEMFSVETDNRMYAIETDELPCSYSGVQSGAEKLSRSASEAGRIWHPATAMSLQAACTA